MLGTYEDCKEIAKSRQCATCRDRAMLLVRHRNTGELWEVYCPRCDEDEQFIRPESLTARWRRDPESVPYHIANNLERKYGGNPMTNQALTVISKGEMTERINGARWMHQLTPQQVVTLAEIAVRYGYDPLMGEVTVYEGKIYITLDGALRDAKRVPNFQGIQTTPLTQEEREARGIKQPIAYKCELYRADWRVPAVGIGVADPAQPFRNNPVERAQPHTLAEARAIRRAVRLAREVPNGMIRQDVDPETGEILTTGGEAADATPAESTVAEFKNLPVQHGPLPQLGHSTDPEPVAESPADEPSEVVRLPGDTSVIDLCSDCGGDILAHQTARKLWTSAELISVSKENYGRKLCYACTIKARGARIAEMGGNGAPGSR